MIIAVNSDGTIVEYKHPAIGKEIPFAFETLRKLQAGHHKLILWNVRGGKLLDEAITFRRKRGLEFYAIDQDYPEEEKDLNDHFSRKLRADILTGNRNLDGLPNWDMIYGIVNKRLSCEDLMWKYESEYELKKPRGLFSRLLR